MKPKKGSLCVFDAFNNWTHGVKTVTKGTRYSIPIFIWDKTKDDTYRKINK
jgi:predicted 2-oxoglutarate/Fe(II)-dependent dioxygenase YbiX